MDLAPIHRTSNRLDPIIFQHQIGMPVLPEPALNLVLGLRNGSADNVLCRCAIRVRRRSRYIFFARKPPPKLLFALTDMLAKDVSAGLLVLTEIAPRSFEQTLIMPGRLLPRRVGRSGIRAIRLSRRLARNKTQYQSQRPEAGAHSASARV